MVQAKDLARAGCKYLGTPYSKLDCQAFVEKALSDCGCSINLPGSNAWYRRMTWVGTPEDCKKKYGYIPPGAFLYIWKNDGGEVQRGYHDGKGNASHIGIYTGMTGAEMVNIAIADGDTKTDKTDFGDGAIHSSSTREKVCTSNFAGKAISGGWNRVGLDETIISYFGDESMQVTYQARVVGGKLNFRKQPDTNADSYGRIPDGTVVTVVEDLGGWSKIQYDGKTGYVVSQYLEEITQGQETVTVNRDELQKVYDAISSMLGLRG